MQAGERHSAILIAFAAFAILALASLALLALSSLLGNVEFNAISHPIEWLRSLDRDTAFDTLFNTAELLAGVLGVAITVVAIVVELAATRYSHRITKLFVTEPVNIAVMTLFVLTTVQCVWVSATVDEPRASAVIPYAGYGITMMMVSLSLLIMLPYFYFVFSFISPLSVIQKLRVNAYRIFRNADSGSAMRRQDKTLVAIDELQDIARSAADHGDTRIAMAAVDALAELVLAYAEVRAELPEQWFAIDKKVARDPDFVSLAPSSLEDIREARLWFEVKVMRQYLALMNQTVPKARDVANVIAINSERIGVATAAQNAALLALVIRCFNSYLRTAIRAGDPRTAYYIMNQYRLLAEALLKQQAHDMVREIVEHLRYYAIFSYSVGEPFLLEVAAHDIVRLIEAAVKDESSIVDDLLDLFLELDQEIRNETQEESLLGVRRAQIQLGTFFLARKDDSRARRIVEDLKDEKLQRLQRIRRSLMTEDRPQYWEFTDRGVNFSYLAPERRPYLDTLFAWLSPDAH